MAEDESFVARWSRRKRAGAAERQREEEASAAEASTDAGADEQEAPPPAPADEQPDGGEVPELPPIESLDKDSDYTQFMREGVPEELKRLALRKLWTSDPVLANLDDLLEYGEDFSLPFKSPGLVATLYRVGEGMPAPVKEIAQRIVGGDSETGEAAVEGVAGSEALPPRPADSPATDPGAMADSEDAESPPTAPDKSGATT